MYLCNLRKKCYVNFFRYGLLCIGFSVDVKDKIGISGGNWIRFIIFFMDLR